MSDDLDTSTDLGPYADTIAELRGTAALPFPGLEELPPLWALPPEPKVADFRLSRRRIRTSIRVGTAVAAAVALLASGWYAGWATRGARVRTVAIPAPTTTTTATVSLQPVGHTRASGTASMTGEGDGQQMHVSLSGLPSAGAGGYYVVRLEPRSGTLLTLGILVDGRGDFALPARLVPGFIAIDVGVEGGTPATPTSAVIARGSLT